MYNGTKTPYIQVMNLQGVLFYKTVNAQYRFTEIPERVWNILKQYCDLVSFSIEFIPILDMQINQTITISSISLMAGAGIALSGKYLASSLTLREISSMVSCF